MPIRKLSGLILRNEWRGDEVRRSSEFDRNSLSMNEILVVYEFDAANHLDRLVECIGHSLDGCLT